MSLAQAVATFFWVQVSADAGLAASALLSLFGLFPVMGTIFAMFGAHETWGWSWTEAGLIFILPVLLLAALSAERLR